MTYSCIEFQQGIIYKQFDIGRMLTRKLPINITAIITWIVLNIYLQQLLPTNALRHNCQFDRLYANRTAYKLSPLDKPDELLSDNLHFSSRRNLQASVRNAIRITLDTTDFNVIKTTTHGQAQTTTNNLSFLRKSMLVVQSFFQKRLKVSTVSRVFAPSTCIDFSPSSNDVSNGISASDLHIYVRYVTDNTASYSYAATGASCKTITTRSLPDQTFQQGRPTVGRIIFNTYTTVDRQTSLTNRLFAQITMTAIHETIHILGFDSTLYSTYLNPATGNIYSPGLVVTQSVSLNAARTGGNNYILKTPFVVSWAKDFFACPSITGMALENEQTTAGVGSHWERLSMYDQLMTATQLGPQKGFSGLTFAILKDMGWYEVDDSFNDTSNYGYHLGCGFYNNACYDTTTYSKYFCDAVANSAVSSCSTNFLGKATCTNQAAAMADGCGIFGGYFHCVDPAQSNDGYKSYTLQRYQTNSFCVQSTFSNVGITSNYRGRCYPFKCFTNKIQFYIDVYTVTCLSTQATVQKTLNALNGYLQCPDFVDFCQQSRKICPNWCSQNGICTRGICNCLPGYYGIDCSKTNCVSGQFYDETTSTCVTSCPSGTYSNKYSLACLPCDTTSCQQCRDEPQICTGCLTTPSNPQYFVVSQSSCVSTCPSSTYQDGDYCYDCDATISFCSTCEYQQNNCTSCLWGKFLQNPFYGSCVSSCSGTYSLYDVYNFKCVSTCTNNLVYYSGGCTACPNPTDGNCDLCANGTYKYIGDQLCHSDCPSTYFQNNDTRFCEKCDLSCKQCDGAYPQNCTQCLSSSNNKYLLLSRMCVSKCPLGFYANDASGTCQLCPPNQNCATCKLLTNTTVVCQTCKYNYYLQTNLTCTTGCDFAYFKNKWKYTCDPCSNDCGNCTTSSSSSCIDCRSGKVFLGNISGKYCLADCPTYYYYRSGTNCLDCYTTCKTCNGVNNNNCLTCVSGLFLSSGMCRYVCPAGSYPRNTTGTCQTCNTNCTFCFGPTIDNCTACSSGLVLNNYTCATACPTGLTVNQWGVCFEFLCVYTVSLLIALSSFVILA